MHVSTARVEAGEKVDVTNYGRLEAQLVPIPESTKSRQALIDAGILIPARRPTAARSPRPLPDNSRSLSDALADLRDDE